MTIVTPRLQTVSQSTSEAVSQLVIRREGLWDSGTVFVVALVH